jgi:hypothetical protein
MTTTMPVENPRHVLRVMCEWASWPFWLDPEEYMHGENLDPEEVRALFDLPQRVIDTVLEWHARFERHHRVDDALGAGWPSHEYRSDFDRHGDSVCRLLRQHLPDDVVVEYAGCYNGGTIGYY